MRDPILAVPSSGWLTVADAARMLQMTPWGVRWLVNTGRLRCERTHSRQRLFRVEHVKRLVDARADDRIRYRSALLRAVRPAMLQVSAEPRQLSLDFRAPRLRLVGSAGKRRKVA